jgi:hypothetical protein
MFLRAKKIQANKECFHPDKGACNGKIKKAHSLQRNGVLNLIEESINGNNKILSLDSYISDSRGQIKDFKLLGKADASTFFGFCDFHDSQTFSKIENIPFNETEEQLFLHSYRAFAHSYHRKTELLSYHDRGYESGGVFADYHAARFNSEVISLSQLKPPKDGIDSALIDKNYEFLNYFVYTIDRFIPIACSSLIAPRCTFKGTVVNTFKPLTDCLKCLIMINVFPTIEKKTVVIISGIASDKLSTLFLDELDELSDKKLQNAITSLIIEYAENAFMAPSLYNSMSSFHQKSLKKELELCSPHGYSSRVYDGFFKSRLDFFA